MNNLQTLQDAVRDQVRNTVLQAIPAETIDSIVKDYFEKDFKVFVKKELEIVLKDRFNTEIQKVGEVVWSKSGQQHIQNISREVAESIMQGFESSLINNVVNNLRNGRIY